jgi:hypothetical protein
MISGHRLGAEGWHFFATPNAPAGKRTKWARQVLGVVLVKCVQHECSRGSRRKNASPSAAREPQRTTFSGGGRARHTVEAIDATTPFEAKFPPSCSEAKIKGKTGVSKGVVARSARRCGPLFWWRVGVQPKRCQRAPPKASSQRGNPCFIGVCHRGRVSGKPCPRWVSLMTGPDVLSA